MEQSEEIANTIKFEEDKAICRVLQMAEESLPSDLFIDFSDTIVFLRGVRGISEEKISQIENEIHTYSICINKNSEKHKNG